MVSYIKVICLSLCVALSASSVAQATNSEKMFKETVSNAISEYRSSQDISTLSRLIPELSALSVGASKNADAKNTLLSIGPDILNALYETADLEFDAERRPSINTESPGGWYSAGIDPESIKDPKMKAEYTKRDAENRSYAKHYTQQANVFRVIDELAHLFRQGFKGMAVQDISDMLARSGLSSSYGDDFFRRMETQAP